jgi:DNA-binding NarL/FixJ family response regulator
MSLSILVIDNHVVVRRGLAQLLREEFREITLVEAANASEAIPLIQKRSWDLIILEIRLSKENGFEFLRSIRRARADSRILVFTVYAACQFAAQCLRLGTSGYICKDEPQRTLMNAIRSLLAGKKWFPKAMLDASNLPASGTAPAGHPLSSREYDILRMLAAGRRPSDVASDLNVSIKTVTTYKSRIFNKMGWTSIADMVRYVDQTEMVGGSPPLE